MRHLTHKLIKDMSYCIYMESAEMVDTASNIESSVENLKYEVMAMKEALQMLLDAAQEGIDELSDL